VLLSQRTTRATDASQPALADDGLRGHDARRDERHSLAPSWLAEPRTSTEAQLQQP
jgi:hypothetical protein